MGEEGVFVVVIPPPHTTDDHSAHSGGDCPLIEDGSGWGRLGGVGVTGGDPLVPPPETAEIQKRKELFSSAPSSDFCDRKRKDFSYQIENNPTPFLNISC